MVMKVALHNFFLFRNYEDYISQITAEAVRNQTSWKKVSKVNAYLLVPAI